MVVALFCPIWKIFPVWFHCTMFRRLCCFRFTAVLEIVIEAHDITFQDINLQPYFKIACVKSVLWPALISNVVNVSLSGGNLGYWTVCNNFKRYCALPYTVYQGIHWCGQMGVLGSLWMLLFASLVKHIVQVDLVSVWLSVGLSNLFQSAKAFTVYSQFGPLVLHIDAKKSAELEFWFFV